MTVAPHTKSRPRVWLVASKAAFLENYLAFSTLILNECHKKKPQPFSLSGVRSGSRTIQISFHSWLLHTCDRASLLFFRGGKEEKEGTPDRRLDSFLQRVVTVNAKPTKSLKFAIRSRKSFVTNKQFTEKMCPKTAWKCKNEAHASLIFRSVIPHDELINVVYLFFQI